MRQAISRREPRTTAGTFSKMMAMLGVSLAGAPAGALFTPLHAMRALASPFLRCRFSRFTMPKSRLPRDAELQMVVAGSRRLPRLSRLRRLVPFSRLSPLKAPQVQVLAAIFIAAIDADWPLITTASYGAFSDGGSYLPRPDAQGERRYCSA